MTVQEPSEGFVDLVERDIEIIDKVHRDMVAIGTTVLNANDLEGVKDGTDKTLRLGNKELGRSHIGRKATRADESANEEPTVKLVLTTNGMIDMDLAVVGEARCDVIVRKTAELE
jgi:hypothetical protein